MKYSFAALKDNIATRKFGGTNASTGMANPYLSGTFFVWFDYIPQGIMNYLADSGISSTDEVKAILAASCIGVTPPGNTLNPIEFTGLGGVKWYYPGNLTPGDSLSIKSLEFSKTPVGNIYHSWVKMIRDYRLGVSEILKDDAEGQGYTKEKFASTIYYWTTAPDGITVEYYACYDGAWPTKDPQDLYSGDVDTVGRVDIDQEFKFDNMWHESWVKSKCETFAASITTSLQKVASYKY